MAVHHDLAVVGAGEEKRPAHPQEVLRTLRVQGDARAYSGVHEKIIALDMAEAQVAQETFVRGRQARRQGAGQTIKIVVQHL